MNKKSAKIAVVALLYAALSIMIYVGAFTGGNAQEALQEPVSEEPSGVETDVTDDNYSPDTDREYLSFDNTTEYARSGQNSLYIVSEDVALKEEDSFSILKRFSLPKLVRMSSEDADTLMSDLQVLRRIETLGIDPEEFTTPEYNWKAIYNDSVHTVEAAVAFEEVVEFDGSSAGELNQFLADNAGKRVLFTSDTLILDETINVPSNVALDGAGITVTGDAQVKYGFLIENEENIEISNFNMQNGYEEGIYVINSDNLLIYNNDITGALYKAVCVMGTCSYVNLVNNSIHENGNGAVFFNGSISRCIISGNAIFQNYGTRNLTAGLVFSSMELEDIYTPYNEFKDEYLYNQLDSPNNNVIKDNLIQDNYSSGFYCDGGYMNYVINNTIEENEKEGMCLDYGTFGTYVSRNTIKRNGDRNRQTDEDLEADFILGLGRLADGSSTAKLPGISIDNSAYNTIYNNIIIENSGSGVKMVRSGYRNLILSNSIIDNNAGQNEAYHGFGIELGHASTPDEPVIGLDFTADYENIIARNVISGHHYSGIYLAEDTYCNDLIDNVIMDCGSFSVENFSMYFNSSVGNNTNVGTLNFDLK